MADAKHDKVSLQEVWNAEKREGIEKLIKDLESIKEEDREELANILEYHFDEEKKPFKPVVLRRENVNVNNGGGGNGNRNNNHNNVNRRRGGNGNPRMQQQQQQQNGKENRGPHSDSHRRRRSRNNSKRRTNEQDMNSKTGVGRKDQQYDSTNPNMVAAGAN